MATFNQPELMSKIENNIFIIWINIHPKVLQILLQHYNEGSRQLPIDENTEKDIVEQYLLELLTEPQI